MVGDASVCRWVKMLHSMERDRGFSDRGRVRSKMTVSRLWDDDADGPRGYDGSRCFPTKISTGKLENKFREENLGFRYFEPRVLQWLF
jgi:hypothetical protein